MLALAIVTLCLVVITQLSLIGFIVFFYISLKEQERNSKKREQDQFTLTRTEIKTVDDKVESVIKHLNAISDSIQVVQEPKRKNDIETKTLDEIPLDETMRIPIVTGVNVRFEDEQKSYPVDLMRYGEEIDKNVS